MAGTCKLSIKPLFYTILLRINQIGTVSDFRLILRNFHFRRKSRKMKIKRKTKTWKMLYSKENVYFSLFICIWWTVSIA